MLPNGTLALLYSGMDKHGVVRGGLALLSNDLKTWRKSAANPVLTSREHPLVLAQMPS